MTPLDSRRALICYLTMITFQFYDWLMLIRVMDRAEWIDKRIAATPRVIIIVIWKTDYG